MKLVLILIVSLNTGHNIMDVWIFYSTIQIGLLGTN